MEITEKTIQEHIWNNVEVIGTYSVWDWVVVLEHFKLSIKKDKNYQDWVKELKQEGRLESFSFFKPID